MNNTATKGLWPTVVMIIAIGLATGTLFVLHVAKFFSMFSQE